jgi:hypothetical protein
VKNLLKFMSIGLVLAVALYSQVAPNVVVEAADAAIANNDIEWMAQVGGDATVQKFYPAASGGATTHAVRFFINDTDLDVVQSGSTTFTGTATAAVSTIAAAIHIELDAAVETDCNTGGTGACAGGVVESNSAMVSGATPPTSVVANTLDVKFGASGSQTSVNHLINAQDDVNATFRLSADTITTATALLTASYKFNSPQVYAEADKRVKVTSSSDATGEWVAITEVAAQTGTTAAIASKYFTNVGSTLLVGSDAANAAADDNVVWVQDGDTLTVTFYGAGTDSDGDTIIQDDEIGAVIASTTATIDDTAPTITNVSPVDGTLTKDTSPSLEFTIEDAGSGLGTSVTTFGTYADVFVGGCILTDAELGVSSFAKDKITVTYTPPVGMEFSDTSLTTADGVIDCTDASDGDAASEGVDRQKGGFEINDIANTADATGKRTHDGTQFSWKIVARDAAGNAKSLGGLSGSAASDLNIIIDSEPPATSATITAAKAWSTGDKADVTDNSSIKVLFNESLDANSVEASDFTVSGTGVTSSTINSVTVGGTGVLTGAQVYLDLAADLGPNAKPKVKLVGEVTDLAGNALKPTATQTTGITLGTAADGVKPTISDITVGDVLFAAKDTATLAFTANENMTKTNETLANGCTCGSISGASAVTDDLNSGANDDTTKLSVTLSSPTAGSATLKQITAPFTTDGIYGIAVVGKDSANNKGVGGITKVTDEDISKYFTVAGRIGLAGDAAGGAMDADNDEITVKLAKWPIADSDGDGELSDEIIGLSVDGVAKTAAQLAQIHIEHLNFGELEHATLATGTVATLGAIAAGSTVKITYYYVNAENTVEVDTTAPTVSAYGPVDGTSTIDTTPSFSVTWDDDEYAGDTQTTVTLDSATLKDPDAVTTDILPSMTSTDDKAFYYKPLEALAFGEYKLTFVATDTAGNTSAEKSYKVTIKERTKTSVTMSPGWNLVSLPGEPADGAINSVITSSQVNTVLTYDPSTPGGWLTAVRDGDVLVGTLTTMDASHAYWVQSNNSDPIKTDIPGYEGGVAQVPPTVAVVAGWNLIPAATITGASTWDPDTYLAGLDWTKLKSWDAAAETWEDVLPRTNDNTWSSADQTAVAAHVAGTFVDTANDAKMVAGKGYWLYANEAGVIVP